MDYLEIKCDQCHINLYNISDELDNIVKLLIDKSHVHAAIRLDRLSEHMKKLIREKND